MTLSPFENVTSLRAQRERVREEIRGNVRHLRRDVGNDVEVVVELGHAVEHVLLNFLVGLSVGDGRVERAEVVQDRELERLVSSQIRARRRVVSASCQYHAARGSHTHGFEEPERSWSHSFLLVEKLEAEPLPSPSSRCPLRGNRGESAPTRGGGPGRAAAYSTPHCGWERPESPMGAFFTDS